MQHHILSYIHCLYQYLYKLCILFVFCFNQCALSWFVCHLAAWLSFTVSQSVQLHLSPLVTVKECCANTPWWESVVWNVLINVLIFWWPISINHCYYKNLLREKSTSFCRKARKCQLLKFLVYEVSHTPASVLVWCCQKTVPLDTVLLHKLSRQCHKKMTHTTWCEEMYWKIHHFLQ